MLPAHPEERSPASREEVVVSVGDRHEDAALVAFVYFETERLDRFHVRPEPCLVGFVTGPEERITTWW